METPLLEIRDVKKYFPVKKVHGKEITVKAVDSINLKINQGEIVGLVGESGCGKSTLGKSILKLHEITGGQILFHGEDITNYNERQMRPLREKIQIIFQDPYASLNPKKKIVQSVMAPLDVAGKYTKEEKLEKVRKILREVGLSDKYLEKYPHEMSGGQRQRVVIARALINDPELVICDEPVSALDVSIQAQILNLMKQLQNKMGLTYMFITHDLSVVNHFSDDIAVMYLGKLIEKAPSEELFAHPTHPYTQALLSAIPVPSLDNRRERILLKGEITSPIEPPKACRFANRCPYATDRCRSEEPQLKEISPGHFVSCFLTD